jgi:hypothetical protein
MDHGIGKVFEVDILGVWADSLQFGWGECRGHCIMGMYVNMLRACWDTILCAANGTAKQVRCAMWGVALLSGAVLAVGVQVIGETAPGVLFQVIL